MEKTKWVSRFWGFWVLVEISSSDGEDEVEGVVAVGSCSEEFDNMENVSLALKLRDFFRRRNVLSTGKQRGHHPTHNDAISPSY